jgi:hypothetical protein
MPWAPRNPVLADGTKKCNKCGEVKPVSEYHPHKSIKCGLFPHCKECHRNHYRKNRFEWRNGFLNRTYGISFDEYLTMFQAQGGLCAICHGVQASGKVLAVDHDHETGKVRGLLCGRCNMALGLIDEDPFWPDKVGKYLTEAKKDG